jgi:hypothetical protein
MRMGDWLKIQVNEDEMVVKFHLIEAEKFRFTERILDNKSVSRKENWVHVSNIESVQPATDEDIYYEEEAGFVDIEIEWEEAIGSVRVVEEDYQMTLRVGSVTVGCNFGKHLTLSTYVYEDGTFASIPKQFEDSYKTVCEKATHARFVKEN